MHQQFLLAALEQAKKGQGHCAPNPCVGAVAVQNGTIIAQAYHQGAGSLHAEQLLLTQFPPSTPGVTVYSTLEPCNHWGKTPPCVQALIQHGVEQVVFACYDPNPLVAQNNSTKLLEKQGVKVLSLAVAEIDAFYKSYSHWVRTKKPRVTVKIAHTLDGKIAGANGERTQISNAVCEEFTQKMRLASDVILTTARTVHLDNPKMNVRLQGSAQAKSVAIIDRTLSLSGKEQIFQTADHCSIYHSCNDKIAYPNSSFYQVPEKDGTIDLAAVMAHLGGLGFHDVWVEVGGILFTALHKQGLVDRTYLYIAPKSLGPQALSAYLSPDIFDRQHTVSWQAMGDNMMACFDWQEVACLPE